MCAVACLDEIMNWVWSYRLEITVNLVVSLFYKKKLYVTLIISLYMFIFNTFLKIFIINQLYNNIYKNQCKDRIKSLEIIF